MFSPVLRRNFEEAVNTLISSNVYQGIDGCFSDNVVYPKIYQSHTKYQVIPSGWWAILLCMCVGSIPADISLSHFINIVFIIYQQDGSGKCALVPSTWCLWCKIWSVMDSQPYMSNSTHRITMHIKRRRKRFTHRESILRVNSESTWVCDSTWGVEEGQLLLS